MRWLTRVAWASLGAAGTLTILGAAWVFWPLPAGLAMADAEPGLVIEDRHGIELRTTRGSDGSLRRWLPLGTVDADLIAAFVATEDRRFHAHAGVDPRAALRALRANLAAGGVVSGGSTITMQVARMLRRTPRSWSGKVAQALWALRLERHLSKQQILEQYLNRVPLGQGAVGVDAAATLYFGASAAELSLGQAALLAGIAHAPSADNPLVSPARAGARRAFALRRLVRGGYATEVVAARAAGEPVLERRRRPFLAPHFTTRLLGWVERDGADAAGVWRTSLDAGLQAELEGDVRHTVETLRDQGVHQAAVVVLDNHSGELLAWVGSPDFWSDTAGQVDMVASPRQPGSALKPFVYGLAFDRGWTPASVLADVARVYQTSTGPYAPRNYDRRFHGPVRAREALASSYNVPAVELADRLGVGSVLAVLRRAGFASLDRTAEHYGLGLALGNGDVTLLELANGYRAIAEGGVWRPVQWRAGSAGRAVPPGTRVMSARSAALVLDVLSDRAARIPGFGLETPLDFPFAVAAKTGTSRHFTDNWAVAVTGGFTVAVWAGNFSGRPMAGVSGISGAGPLLHRAVLATARRYPPGEWTTPAAAGAVPVTICRLSGAIAGAACPHATEWFAPGTEPASTCSWHRDGTVALPAEYAEWSERTGGGEARELVARRTGDPVPADSTDSRFRIVSPRNGDRYRIPPGVDARYATVALRAAGGGAERWTVDGRPVEGRRWRLQPGVHTIQARGRHDQSDRVTIEVD